MPGMMIWSSTLSGTCRADYVLVSLGQLASFSDKQTVDGSMVSTAVMQWKGMVR